MAEYYDRLHYLLNQYANNNTTQVEENELFDLLSRTENAEIEPMLMAILEQTTPMPDTHRRERILGTVLRSEEFGARSSETQAPVHRIHLLRRARWWAAASIILLLSVGAYFMFFIKPAKQDEIVKTQEEGIKNDVAPGKDGAILKLANGETIVLDTAADGSLVMQSNTQVRKVKGMLVYQPENSASLTPEVVYNTLETPKGRKYRLTLPDGTDVWLDAASSITFPSMFTGNDRKVEITGQAYFEVRQDKQHPFKVNIAGKGEVEVLGTHFNVNSYTNEKDIKVTLLEGSVKVRSGNADGLLKPGQQAQIISGIKVVDDVDVELVVAWKNGLTRFKSADIKSIMRQVERWYDVVVVYEGSVPERTFSGGVSRDANLSELLRILEVSKIHFRIEGKKLVVMP